MRIGDDGILDDGLGVRGVDRWDFIAGFVDGGLSGSREMLRRKSILLTDAIVDVRE